MTLPIIRMKGKRSYPPRVTSFTQTYWDALKAGRWQATKCNGCAKVSFPPKTVCPECWSTDIRWEVLNGLARLYSWTCVHAAPSAFERETPYHLCIADMETGLRVATRLALDEGQKATIGMVLEPVVLEYDDGPILGFRPA